jgi:DNA modification methylase
MSDERWRVEHGDTLAVLEQMPDESVDAIVTDPPYGLSREPDVAEVLTHWLAGDDYQHRGGGFMGQQWDAFVPGPSVWREALRVLKPGGFLLAFGGTRTYDLLVVALRLAGFEIRDRVLTLNGDVGAEVDWVYGSGWPKSRNIGKAIDKAAGADREVIGEAIYGDGHVQRSNGSDLGRMNDDAWTPTDGRSVTAPATPEAETWEGWGTALKPAHEPIAVARKPFRGTVEAQVLATGTGALNIDACRISTGAEQLHHDGSDPARRRGIVGAELQPTGDAERNAAAQAESIERANRMGRWPANVALVHVNRPVLRLRENTPRAVRAVILDYYRTPGALGDADLSQLRGALRVPPVMGEERPSEVLPACLQERAPGEGARRHAPNDRTEAFTGSTSEDVSQPGAPVGSQPLGDERAASLAVEGRQLPIGRLSPAEHGIPASRGTGGASPDDAEVRLRAGAPPSHGANARPAAAADGTRAPRQRGQARQSADELDAGELGRTLTRAPGNGAASGAGDRAEPPLDVPADRVPSRWRHLFDPVTEYALGCRPVGQRRVPTGVSVRRNIPEGARDGGTFNKASQRGEDFTYAEPDGLETIEAWQCEIGCPVALLDDLSGDAGASAQVMGTESALQNGSSGNAYGASQGREGRPSPFYADAGGASRFFYSGKASPLEREAGLDELPIAGRTDDTWGTMQTPQLDRAAPRENWQPREVRNRHPTVKPIDLMRWLVRLVARPGAVVLDTHAGSGSTGCAAVLEGCEFIGIDDDQASVTIARARIAFWAGFPVGTPTVRVLAQEVARRRATDEATERRRQLASAGQLDLLASSEVDPHG